MPCGETACRGPVGLRRRAGWAPGRGKRLRLTFPSSGAGPRWEGNRGPLGFLPEPYRIGMGGRCWGGRLLAARLEELRVAGSRGGFARPTELFAVGRYWRPRSKKKTTPKPKNQPFSQHVGERRPPKDDRAAFIRVYLYPFICVYVRLFPPDPWDGSGWKRVAGRSRGAIPEGREGRVRPCAAQMRMGGLVSRAVPRPPDSPGRPGSMQAASGSGLPAPVQ